MALFKIFNNITSNNELPNTAVKGYCYFDATSNLFYIDIKDTPTGYTLPSNKNSDKYREYRVPLNSYLSTYSVRATNDINGNSINPMTAKGDLIYGTLDSNNKAKYTRLGIGTTGHVLKVGSDGTPEWGEIVALPKGGTAGLYLIKSSATDGDAEWSTLEIPELVGSSAIGSSTNPIYWDGTLFTTINSYQGKANTAGTADKVANSLSFTVGGVSKGSYNGSVAHAIDVNAADLNISSALSFLGRTNVVPTTSSVILVSGNVVTAKAGNVVIYTGDNTEYLYDDTGTWVNIGSATSYSLGIHIHGHIDNGGYLTNSSGTPLENRVIITDSTGMVNALSAGTDGLVLKMVSGAPTWSSDIDTDTKVTNTLNTAKKFYLTGTESSSTNTGTQFFDTGVYASATAGELVATTFTGALNGNASSASKLNNKLTIGTYEYDGSTTVSIPIYTGVYSETT